MIRRTRMVLTVLALFGAGLQAQDSTVAAGRDSLYLRAQRLVNEGKGDVGRAMVDSLLKATPPGSSGYAEGLFWRASLATTSAEAERDYRSITVDFPLSPRAQDALLRLAQLEIQRGDRPLALGHLQRLVRENSTGTVRARAAYWMARVYFEMNDVPHACTAIADSRGAMLASDVELRNQVDYVGQRCPIASTSPAKQPVVVASAPLPATPPAQVPVTDTLIVRDTTARDTSVVKPDTSTATVPAPKTVTKAPATAPVATASTQPATTKKPTTASADPQRFSVQVAAYGTAPEAQRLVKKYRTNGYDARVAGTVAPFRVRIGRFKTRAEAVALAKVLKEKSGAAFVVLAEPK